MVYSLKFSNDNMVGTRLQRKILLIVAMALGIAILWYLSLRSGNSKGLKRGNHSGDAVVQADTQSDAIKVTSRSREVYVTVKGRGGIKGYQHRLGFSTLFKFTFLSGNMTVKLSAQLESHKTRFNTALKDFNIWFTNNCLKTISKGLRIDNIALIVDRWRNAKDAKCRDLFTIFSRIYRIRTRDSKVIISDSFSKKILKWFNGNEELLKETKLQHLTSVDNLYTQESTVFNPLRAKRPGAGGGGGPEVKKAVDELIKKSIQDCDFCNYKKMTAQDTFGRIESKYAISVANTFKIEKYHGLVLFRHHNPFEFTEEQFLDLMDVTQRWFVKAHEDDSKYANPHIYWDVLPKASASQVHPHLHVNLASEHYYAKWAHLHAASLQYAAEHAGANYFTDVVKVHGTLGLTANLGSATVMAYITPQASHEVILISSRPGKDIFRLLFYTMRAYIDDMGLFAMSAGMVFPKLVATPQNGDLPMIMRLVYRGAVTSTRADISSIELFGTPNVNVDPYRVIQSIRNTMAKHEANIA